MNILIIGGAGFIGKYLTEHLLNNHKITIYDDLSNSSMEKISFLIDRVRFIKGDIMNFEKLAESTRNFDVVIHLAAKSNVTESIIHPKDTINVNVNGTTNLLKCCVQNKIKKIIFASSAAVYGDCKMPITERTSTNPQSPYGQSKIDAEKIIKETCQENNINYIILRMFNVYGKGQNNQYAGVITKFLRNITQNIPLEIYGDGKHTRDFVSINDVVESFDCAISSDKNGTYNIASGVSISINDLVAIMFEVFGKKVDIKYKAKQKGDIQNSVADVSLAQNEIGFSAKRSLKEELVRC